MCGEAPAVVLSDGSSCEELACGVGAAERDGKRHPGRAVAPRRHRRPEPGHAFDRLAEHRPVLRRVEVSRGHIAITVGGGPTEPTLAGDIEQSAQGVGDAGHTVGEAGVDAAVRRPPGQALITGDGGLDQPVAAGGGKIQDGWVVAHLVQGEQPEGGAGRAADDVQGGVPGDAVRGDAPRRGPGEVDRRAVAEQGADGGQAETIDPAPSHPMASQCRALATAALARREVARAPPPRPSPETTAAAPGNTAGPSVRRRGDAGAPGSLSIAHRVADPVRVCPPVRPGCARSTARDRQEVGRGTSSSLGGSCSGSVDSGVDRLGQRVLIRVSWAWSRRREAGDAVATRPAQPA